MSYRRRCSLGQVPLTRSQISAALPRTGIGGSGITPEMVLLGGAVVAMFAGMVVWYRVKDRLWEAAIPDAEDRAGTRLAASLIL